MFARWVVTVPVDIFFFCSGLAAIAVGNYRQSAGDHVARTVVLDERRAGQIISWAVPGAPVHEPGPLHPSGGVPRRGRS